MHNVKLYNTRFKKNADVLDNKGKKVGTIDRVVLDPRTKTITHVVVREGFLFTEDKVVPIEWFDQTTEDEVVLNFAEEDVDSLPLFEETHYMPSYESDPETRQSIEGGYAQPYYWYPPTNVYWWGYPGYNTYFGFTEPPLIKTVERQIPEGTVPLEEGAEVISADNDHVGDVEQIFADPDTNRATHFVISQGLIFKDRKLIPTAWIDTITENKVYLSVDSDFLDHLQSYKGN